VPSKELTVGDATLEVLERGEGSPLLFLHGEDGLLFSDPLIDELAQSFRVIAPHHPGWGASTRPEYVTDVRDLATVYAEFLEQLDAGEDLIVVGCSFGAWVAAELALLAGTRFSALVLAAPTGIKLGDRETRDFADIYMHSFEDVRALLYADVSRAPDLTDRPDADYRTLAVAQESTTRFCWAPYMHDPKLRHWLRRITAPTLVVAGDADRFALLPEYYAGYAALIGAKGAALQTIPGAGHRVEEEQPQELARRVREFAATAGAAADESLTAVKGR
jgi:pimeloyl-ACP methyl ester carboxylesterase